MRVLVAHNRYQHQGGEDKVAAAEIDLLQRHGHDVLPLYFDNDHIVSTSQQLVAATGALFMPSSYTRVLRACQDFKPDLMHVHNFFPSMSPSVFYAAEKAGVPRVATIHNYRLVCAAATLFRDMHPCEDCLEQHSFLPGVRHGCYRGSKAGSAIVGAMSSLHAAVGTWAHHIDRYILLTRFAVSKLKARLPEEKICVRPNFVRDPGVGDGRGDFGLFVGRLSTEKGLATLLEADRRDSLPIKVYVAGDGPMRAELDEVASRPGSKLTVLGAVPSERVLALMKEAKVLLVPSHCYEGFPVAVVESLAVGTPILAAQIGSLAEIVKPEFGGFHTSANPASFASALGRMVRDPDALQIKRARAREEFERFYTEAAAYQSLMRVYAEVVY